MKRRVLFVENYALHWHMWCIPRGVSRLTIYWIIATHALRWNTR